MITYDWNISQLDCIPDSDGRQDYVVTAHWHATARTEPTAAASTALAGFAVVEGEAFTPYDQLTKEQVLGWIWANGVDKDATEAAVAQQIENQINPPIVSRLGVCND
jgi:hypothetical protein